MKKEISSLLITYIVLISLLIIICCLAACTPTTNPVVRMDNPLKPDSTIIVVPNQMTAIGQFLEHGIQDVYRLPYNYHTFPVLREKGELATSYYPDTAGKTFISVGNTFMSDKGATGP